MLVDKISLVSDPQDSIISAPFHGYWEGLDQEPLLFILNYYYYFKVLWSLQVYSSSFVRQIAKVTQKWYLVLAFNLHNYLAN